MNTREILILKTLGFKQLNTTGTSGWGSGMIDKLFAENPEQADELTKNVCARIPLQLAQEMESIGGMLEINKRELITMAIQDFLEKARQTMTEFDAWPRGEEGSK